MLYCHAFVHLTSLYMHCSVFVFYLTLPPKQDKNEAKNLRAKKANSQKPKSKIKCKNNQNNAYKEMHDAQMHDNEASNA